VGREWGELGDFLWVLLVGSPEGWTSAGKLGHTAELSTRARPTGGGTVVGGKLGRQGVLEAEDTPPACTAQASLALRAVHAATLQGGGPHHHKWTLELVHSRGPTTLVQALQPRHLLPSQPQTYQHGTQNERVRVSKQGGGDHRERLHTPAHQPWEEGI